MREMAKKKRRRWRIRDNNQKPERRLRFRGASVECNERGKGR